MPKKRSLSKDAFVSLDTSILTKESAHIFCLALIEYNQYSSTSWKDFQGYGVNVSVEANLNEKPFPDLAAYVLTSTDHDYDAHVYDAENRDEAYKFKKGGWLIQMRLIIHHLKLTRD